MHERRGRHQKRGPPAPAETRIVGNQAVRQQRLDYAAAVRPTDTADVGAGQWLLAGHDRQHLERGPRQRLGWRSVQKAFDEWSAVWRGHQLDLVTGLEQRESVGRRSSEKGTRPIDAPTGWTYVLD